VQESTEDDPHDSVRIVWVEEWYDGPATGVAEHSGQRYWFTPLADDWYQEQPRRLVLRRLVAEEASSLDERMEDSGRLAPDEYWSKYHPTDRIVDGYEVHDGEVVGWFTEPPTG
jgi:hypothetical protein